MRILSYIFFSLFLILSPLLSQAQETKAVQLSGSLAGCGDAAPDSVRILMYGGGVLNSVAAAPVTVQEGNANFSFSIQGLPNGFYFIGLSPQNMLMLLLGPDPQVHIQGECQQIAKAMIYNSPSNVQFNEVMTKVNRFQQVNQQLIGKYRQVQRQGPVALEAVNKEFAALDQQKMTLLDSLRKANPFLAKIVALQTYISFQGDNKGYKSEAMYFATEYFSQVDFSDPVYNSMPLFSESIQSYASNLAQIGLNTTGQRHFAEVVLSKVPAGSPAYQTALLSFALGFMTKSDDNFAHFAKTYLNMYPNTHPNVKNQLQQNIKSVESFLVGAEAPNFALPTPEGDTLSLKDLRGKVVMVDFWASWCGPCRKENPKVKKVYEKYKDKGFTIVGVSLDRTKDRWLKAIEADGLEWHHVSDLKFWQSEAAKLYKVHSIPYTVLLDQEGKILAKGLRSEALERELEAVFGK